MFAIKNQEIEELEQRLSRSNCDIDTVNRRDFEIVSFFV